MIYLVARVLVFLSITLGGSFAFIAMTTPGNSSSFIDSQRNSIFVEYAQQNNIGTD